MDPILVDSTKCTHDMQKSYVASSYNTIMRVGDWRSSTIVILKYCILIITSIVCRGQSLAFAFDLAFFQT